LSKNTLAVQLLSRIAYLPAIECDASEPEQVHWAALQQLPARMHCFADLQYQQQPRTHVYYLATTWLIAQKAFLLCCNSNVSIEHCLQWATTGGAAFGRPFSCGARTANALSVLHTMTRRRLKLMPLRRASPECCQRGCSALTPCTLNPAFLLQRELQVLLLLVLVLLPSSCSNVQSSAAHTAGWPSALLTACS
jgi:hypothetical protein